MEIRVEGAEVAQVLDRANRRLHLHAGTLNTLDTAGGRGWVTRRSAVTSDGRN